MFTMFTIISQMFCLNTTFLLLGKKKFMLGEEASQTDCAVFGILSQIHWHGCGGASEKFYKSKCI